MKLTSIEIANFRKFEKLSCSFHPNMTVLVSENGGGKTTLLDAARIALWPFVKGFDLGSQTGKSATIAIEDVRLMRQHEGNMESQLPSSVYATGKWGDELEQREWALERQSINKRTGNYLNPIAHIFTKLSKKLERQVRAGEYVDLPLISYLGTSRLLYQGRNTQAKDIMLDREDYSRTSGYLNCLSYTSRFSAFNSWYTHICRSYNQSLVRANKHRNNVAEYAYLAQNLAHGAMISENLARDELSETGKRFEHVVYIIQSSIDSIIKPLTGWHSLEFDEAYQQQLVMYHDKQGVLPFDLLSDGLRNAIAMVADIAFRAYKLNPHMGKEAAKQTSGIVMIDEVDMFLHPKWQQTILPSLQEAFPKIQFIVTTHSPQVLTSVPSESIRVIQDGKVFSAPQGSEGAESKRMLERVFGITSRPQQNLRTQDLARYRDYVYNDKWIDGWLDEMLRLKSELHQHFGSEDPELTELDLYLENREWELSLEKD